MTVLKPNLALICLFLFSEMQVVDSFTFPSLMLGSIVTRLAGRTKDEILLIGKQWNVLSWSDSQHKQTAAQAHYPLGLMHWTGHLVFNSHVNLLTMILINNMQHTFPGSLNGNYHMSLSQKCHRQRDGERMKMALDDVIIQGTLQLCSNH